MKAGEETDTPPAATKSTKLHNRHQFTVEYAAVLDNNAGISVQVTCLDGNGASEVA